MKKGGKKFIHFLICYLFKKKFEYSSPKLELPVGSNRYNCKCQKMHRTFDAALLVN